MPTDEKKPSQGFIDRMTGPLEVNVPQCHSCKHYHFGTLTCDAYPEGIPQSILLNIADHTKAFPGDHGIHFEPIDAKG